MPFKDAQVQDVDDRQVAPSVVAIIPVPLHTEQLHSSSREEEAQSQACPLHLLIPEVKSHTVDHWNTTYAEGGMQEDRLCSGMNVLKSAKKQPLKNEY